MWKAIGVGAETVIIPRQRATDREYRVTRPGFELTHQPNELTERALQRLQSHEIPTAQNNWRGNNRARYSSPEYDALADTYIVTLDARERLEVAKQLVHHISDQLPAMGLLYRIDLMLIANKLVNVSAETVVRNAPEWDVR
jgi:ABC-type oligopeptide transport system substrate-binding subunit